MTGKYLNFPTQFFKRMTQINTKLTFGIDDVDSIDIKNDRLQALHCLILYDTYRYRAITFPTVKIWLNHQADDSHVK